LILFCAEVTLRKYSLTCAALGNI